MIARFVKERTGGMDVVYGGGLKTDNAEMLASIDEIDGGLIALTRFSGEIGWYPRRVSGDNPHLPWKVRRKHEAGF